MRSYIKWVPVFCFLFVLGLFSPVIAARNLGQDVDGNGLWDDVQQYIAETYPAGSEGFKAANQAALSIQHFIGGAREDVTAEEIKNNLIELGKGAQCFFYVQRMTSEQSIAELKKVILGSQGRKEAFEIAEYLSADVAVPVEQDPKTWWKDCRFPVRILQNWPKN